MANAKSTISGDPSSNAGYDATAGAVLDLQLENQPSLDVYKTQFSVGRATSGAPALTFSPSSGLASPPNGIVSVTMPGSGVHGYELICTVNDGVDTSGVMRPEYRSSRIVAIRDSVTGKRKIIVGETTEYDAVYGWTEAFNEAVLGGAYSTGNLSVTGDLTVSGTTNLLGQTIAGNVTLVGINTMNPSLTIEANGNPFITGDENSDVFLYSDLDVPGTVSAADVEVSGGVTAASYTLSPALAETHTVSSPAEYDRSAWVNTGGIYQALVSTSADLMFQVDLPHGAVITSVTATIDPAGGHGGVMPNSTPSLTLLRIDDTGTSNTLIGVGDPTTPAASYEGLHSFSATLGTPHVVDRTVNRYAIRVTNEAGANAVSGLRLICLKITWSRTTP